MYVCMHACTFACIFAYERKGAGLPRLHPRGGGVVALSLSNPLGSKVCVSMVHAIELSRERLRGLRASRLLHSIISNRESPLLLECNDGSTS